MALRNFVAVTGFNCAGNYAAIVQHFRTDDPGTTHNFELALDLRDALITPTIGGSAVALLADTLSEDSFISSVKCQELVGGSSAAITLFPADEHPGTFPGELDGAQVSGCVIWLTDGDAGLNGRNFVPGVSEEALENGRFVDDYKDRILAWGNRLIGGLTGPAFEWEFCLRHGAGVTLEPIVNGYLSPTPGTQRRRLVPY